MLVQRLERYLEEIRQRKKLDETRKTVERLQRELLERREKMPYHSMKKSPMKKKANGGGLTKKQKTLPKQLQQKIMKAKKKK